MVSTEPRPKKSPAPAAPTLTDYPDALRMATAAVAALGVGFVLCQFPYGRIASLLLCSAASALAGLSLFGLERRAWVGWTGAGANAVFALVLVACPGQLGLTGWWPRREPDAPTQSADIAPGDWLDAGEFGWEENGVRVALTFATVAPDAAACGRTEQFLWIGARVTNVGTRAAEFTGWEIGSPREPVLTATGGARVGAKRSGKFTPVVLAPGTSTECMLMFDVPPADQGVRLELPAGAHGGTTPVLFQIAPGLILRK